MNNYMYQLYVLQLQMIEFRDNSNPGNPNFNTNPQQFLDEILSEIKKYQSDPAFTSIPLALVIIVSGLTEIQSLWTPILGTGASAEAFENAYQLSMDRIEIISGVLALAFSA